MTGDKRNPLLQTPMKWIRTKEVPEYYINAVHPTWTVSDVSFRLGKVIAQGDEVPFTFAIQAEASVVVAWSQIKFLRDMLNHLVESYEKANGELKTPNLPQSVAPDQS